MPHLETIERADLTFARQPVEAVLEEFTVCFVLCFLAPGSL